MSKGLEVTDIEAIHLEWVYTPTSFVENPIERTQSGCSYSIGEGIVAMTVSVSGFSSIEAARCFADEMIKRELDAIKIQRHLKYDLQLRSRLNIMQDGTNVQVVEIEPARFNFSIGGCDISLFDENGKVISSTRQDRLNQQEQLSNISEKYKGNQVTTQMLQSYSASVDDADNEFVHLYEVYDALKVIARLKNNRRISETIAVEENVISDFINLTNNKCIRQARHRGQAPKENRRDASQDELAFVRKTAIQMIIGYAEYLDKTLETN